MKINCTNITLVSIRQYIKVNSGSPHAGKPDGLVQIWLANDIPILCNSHHSTKLYQKISQVCCHLYGYECAARVTTPTATNE